MHHNNVHMIFGLLSHSFKPCQYFGFGFSWTLSTGKAKALLACFCILLLIADAEVYIMDLAEPCLKEIAKNVTLT